MEGVIASDLLWPFFVLQLHSDTLITLKKRKKIMEKDYKLKLKSSKVKLNLVARAATGNHSS